MAKRGTQGSQRDESRDEDGEEEEEEPPRKKRSASRSALQKSEKNNDAEQRDDDDDQQDVTPPAETAEAGQSSARSKTTQKRNDQAKGLFLFGCFLCSETQQFLQPYQQRAVDGKREKRDKPEYTDALEAKRLATAADWHDRVTDETFEEVGDRLRHRHAFQQILDACPLDPNEQQVRDALRSIFNLSCDFNRIKRAGPGFWLVFDQLTLPTLEFLLALARGLTVEDVRTAVTAGALEISPQDDPTPVSGCVTYIRIAQAKNGVNAAANYLVASPGDAPYSFMRLAELGTSAEDLKDVFHTAFVVLGHGPAIEALWTRLDVDDDELQPPNLVPDNRLSTYAGTSAEKQPGGRHEDDEAAARKEQALYAGVRTDPVAANCEQFAIAMQLERGLNSHPGGFIRLFQPPSEVSAVLARIPAPVYGTQHTLASRSVRAYYVAERSFLRSQISDEAFASAVKNGADLARSNGDTVPYVRVMKDNTIEDLTSADKAPWQANTGQGLQLFRHLLRLLNPRIPEQGDIPEETIAAEIGPTIDFYRLVSGTPNFWIHALGTSRILMALKPVVVSTHSKPVFTAICEGNLHLVWRNVPNTAAHQILSAHIPSNIFQYLPPAHENPLWHPICSDGTFLDNVGRLLICRYGAEDGDLALVIPNLDPGVSKYRARESVLAETIITLVSAIDNVAVAQVQQLLDGGFPVPRDDAGRRRQYLENLRSAIEAHLADTGLRAELDKVKAAYRRHTEVARHLEHMQHSVQQYKSGLPRADPYEIPFVTHASASGAARVEQHKYLMAYFEELVSNGLSERASVLIPFQYREDFKSDGYRTWFMKLKPGTRISNSARVYGNTPEAQANATRSHEALASNKAAQSAGGRKTADNHKAKKEHLAVPQNMLQYMLQDTSDLLKKPPHRQQKDGVLSLSHTHRWCFCPQCSTLVLAYDENHKHTCGNDTVVIRPSYFPSLKRIIYPHDIIDDPVFAPYLPQFTDILHEITIDSIFASGSNRKLANSVFPPLDLATHPLPFSTFQGSIWVAKGSTDRKKNATLHVAMALDRCAESLSRCPAHLLPVTAEDTAKAWAKDVLKIVEGGLNYSVVRCGWGYFGLLVPHTGPYFDHACAGTIHRRPVDPTTNHRKMGTRSKGGDRDCGTQQSHEITTAFDLPPEYIRRLIYTKLMVPNQTLREPKKRKSGQ
ncbi:hypothetical protein MSAN_02157600 [Mycena sanguinolenta]|uniref:Uncharacterized protein n=1 Tax=Mycena sanguinolenta TaxID=230812 RepID=A0A8H6XEW9_9AGAR|nr:hypothetical protein MSAN_02157600 [Mycena sanguinolenta]